MGVLQWNSLIAINYVAKRAGVKRCMTCYEALELRPDMVFVHVATIVSRTMESKSAKAVSPVKSPSPSKEDEEDHFDYDAYVSCAPTSVSTCSTVDSEGIIPSSVCKVTELGPNRFKVESRDKEVQKVSLALYREESKKIFAILMRFSDMVEKASCDEAYIEVTKQVQASDQKDGIEAWAQSHFWGH